MRIGSDPTVLTSIDTNVQSAKKTSSAQAVQSTDDTATQLTQATTIINSIITERSVTSSEEEKTNKEKLEVAVKSLNEFLELNKHTSKFVLHEGLGKYFVQLIDPKTEKVVKEIPPRKLLDAFYEMQKLAGVIVDEKV